MTKNILYLALLLIAASPGLWGCNSTGNASGDGLSSDTTLSQTVREWSKMIEKNPENMEYRVNRAKDLAKEGRYELALSDIDLVIENQPDKVENYIMKADILMGLNRTFDASKVYKKATEVDPESEEALYNLARFNLLVKEYKKSEIQFKELLERNNAYADAYFFLGTLYKETEDTTRAIRHYQYAVEADNDYYDAFVQLGALYSEQRDSLGLQYYNNAIRVDPYSDEAFYGKGLLNQRLGNTKAAIEDYQKAIDLNPGHFLAYYNTGYVLFEQKNWDRAIEHFSIAVKFAPDLLKGHYMLGLSNEGKGNYQQAMADYQRCLQLDPNYDPAKAGILRVEESK